MADGGKLNVAPHTASQSGLPLSNRGVRHWCGIDWVAGSVDLFDLLREAGRGYSRADEDGIGALLAAVGPRPKPKDGDAVQATGELSLGKATPFVAPDQVTRQVVEDVFGYLFGGSGLVLSVDAGPGKFYAYRYVLRNVWGQVAGMIEIGGCLTLRKGGRPSARFELTGLGCAIWEQRGDASPDHAERWWTLRAKLERVATMLSRVDVAYDDFMGERDLALARAMYEVGEFDYTFAGERKRPKARGFDDYGSGDGSTFYIGHSTSEKQLRVYEKGKQLGDKESLWVRWELQLRSSTRKRLKLVILTDPEAYMRGAFECLDFVSSCMQRLEVTKEATKATVKSVLRHARRMYGGTFKRLRLLAPDGESFLALMETLQNENVPRWARVGRPSWADVETLIAAQHDQENANGG